MHQLCGGPCLAHALVQSYLTIPPTFFVFSIFANLNVSICSVMLAWNSSYTCSINPFNPIILCHMTDQGFYVPIISLVHLKWILFFYLFDQDIPININLIRIRTLLRFISSAYAQPINLMKYYLFLNAIYPRIAHAPSYQAKILQIWTQRTNVDDHW